MAKVLKPEQNEFNDYIQMYENYSRFNRFAFDNNNKVKQMFIYFLKAKTIPSEDTLEYASKILDILKTMNLKINTVKYKRRIQDYQSVRKKFSIDLPTAIKIYDDIYLDDLPSLFYIETNVVKEKITEDTNIKKISQEVKIENNIKEWHQYCILVNEAKAFVYKRYPRWGKYEKDEKSKARKDFKKLTEQLQELSSFSNILPILEVLMETKSYYYIDRLLKAKKLLSYNLPNIDTLDIAKQITKNLTEPYK